ncbi:MAG: GreA/GreB family elongation factor [Sumerlaeia bacterium]
MIAEDLELRDKIKDLVRGKKYEQLEELWLEVADGPNLDVEFHEWMARYLSAKELPELLQSLYTDLIKTRNEQGRHDHALEVQRALLSRDNMLEFLRFPLMETLRGLHSERDATHLNEIFREAGFTTDTPDLKKILRRFDDLIGASKGQVFRHRQWGLGIVLELDVRENWAVVDFQKKPGHRMTVEGIKSFLERIPDDHLLARLAKEPDDLKQKTDDDPAAVVRLTLKSFSKRMKVADIKRQFITQGLMTEAEYKKWWVKAKDKVRLDPYIDVSGTGANMVFTLRKDPRSFMDEIVHQLIGAKDISGRRNALRDVAKHGDSADMSPDDVAALYGLFTHPVESGQLETDSQKLGHGLLYEEFSDLFPPSQTNPIDVDGLLKACQDPGELIKEIPVWELQKLAIERYLAVRGENSLNSGERGEASSTIGTVFLHGEPRLAQWIDKMLENQGLIDIRSQCMERVFSRPDRNPDLFVWAAKNLLAGKGDFPHLAEVIHPLMICEELASLTSQYLEMGDSDTGAESKSARNTATKFRAVLMDKNFKAFRESLKKADEEEARRFLMAIGMMRGLPSKFRSELERITLEIHKGLKKPSKSEMEESARAEYHYTTEESLAKARKELSHILNVEVPENSKAIGEAAALGDLKENAEYHAAKDRQKLLRSRVGELEDLIARARVVDPEMVNTDKTRFGTKVTLLRRDTNDREEVTILGMWEGNPDQGIINYLTPLGKQLVNRAATEEFVFKRPDGQEIPYRIEKIEKAI